MQRLDGSWHVKARRNGESMEDHTMFPKDWDNARIRAEVTSAWENRKIRGDK
ncbi:EndoU domain-containing protein [Kingella denitrificans]|uniref:EndoU domain-containing protein n=1 Tax=Kingella denitrificans TaxID=502 RepID=UPI0022B7C8D9|nr:EndoU domain-containing protein [Kingella denitrificans]